MGPCPECGRSGEARSGSVPRFLKREGAGRFRVILRLGKGATSPKLVPTQKGKGSVSADRREVHRGGESYRDWKDHVGERSHGGSGDHIRRWDII